jgi:hypothetical protein
MDAAERALLESTVHDVLERAAAGNSADVDAALLEVGWLEMLDAEPRDAVDVVFNALGATNAAATALDDVVVSALGLEPRRDLACLLPDFATWSPPAYGEGDLVRADGLTTARVVTAKELVVVSKAAGGLRTVTVPIEAVSISPVRGIDPDAGFHRARVEHDGALANEVEQAVWDSAIAAARRAIAHEVGGACRTMLSLARAHALERVQFGRPIVRFQAVRHRLAEALVAVEALEAALAASWDEPGTMTAALAKAIAGRTAKTVATHCQQVLAGIGFTTEHPFHRYLKRTLALEGLFGTSDDIVTDIGRELIARRFVPTLIEL